MQDLLNKYEIHNQKYDCYFSPLETFCNPKSNYHI